MEGILPTIVDQYKNEDNKELCQNDSGLRTRSPKTLNKGDELTRHVFLDLFVPDLQEILRWMDVVLQTLSVSIADIPDQFSFLLLPPLWLNDNQVNVGIRRTGKAV